MKTYNKHSIKYTPELLEKAVQNSFSVSGVLRYLGVPLAGGTHSHISRKIKKYGIDTSHFTGQASNKNKPAKNRKHFSEILVLRPEGSSREDSSRLRRSMIEAGLENKCHTIDCPIVDSWLGKPVVLHIEHRDGNFLNNVLSNLMFLCPMCHSQTDTYCRTKASRQHGSRFMWKNKKCECNVCLTAKNLFHSKNYAARGGKKYKKKYYCSEIGCLENITKQAKRCKKHDYELRAERRIKNDVKKIVWPEISTLLDMLATMPYTTVAQQLGVSDNAIRKHLRVRGIDPPKRIKNTG